MSRILICSDLHADVYTRFAKISDNGINSRLEDCLLALRRIGEIAKEKGVDHLFFLGDLFNSRNTIPVEVYYYVYRELLKLVEHLEVYLLVGNHDQCLRKGNINSVYPFSSICKVIENPISEVVGGVRFTFLPFAANSESYLSYLSHLEPTEYPEILLGHLGLTGAVVGPNEHRMKSDLKAEDLHPSRFLWVVLGHYHRFQVLGDNIIYVGSMLQQDMGERNEEKYALLLDTKDPSMLKKIKLHGPKFLSLNVDEVDESVRGNYVKVTCTDSEIDKVKRKLEAFGPRGYVIEREFKKEFTPRMNIDPLASTDEMIKKYVEHANTSLDKKKLIEVAKNLMS